MNHVAVDRTHRFPGTAAHLGTMEGVSRDVSRLDARRLRLHDPDVSPRRHPAKLHGEQGARGRARHRDAAVPRRRRHRGGHGGRSLGPEGPADVVDPVVFAVRVPQRLLDVLRMLFALRALFGIGMGGVWAAGMPLTLEHWPAHLRGIASGMLQGGYSTGIPAVVARLQFSIRWSTAGPTWAGA